MLMLMVQRKVIVERIEMMTMGRKRLETAVCVGSRGLDRRRVVVSAAVHHSLPRPALHHHHSP
jgi:hypothetical protein